MVRNILGIMPKLIDFHTHNTYTEGDVVFIRSLLLRQVGKESVDYYFYTVGCHPWYVEEYQTYKTLLVNHCSKPNCLAIGEIGLDRTRGDFALEQEVFRDQLDLAKKLKKSVVIHCVRACDRLLYFRKFYPSQTWIVHGFNGSLEQAMQLIGKGIFLSIGASILRGQSRVYKALSKIPLDYVFFETDESDFHIKDIYFAAANLLNMRVEKLQNIVTENFKKIFNVAVE